MPLKNNRNSRDDKSFKNRNTKPSHSSTSRFSKSEKPEGSNNYKKKRFDTDKRAASGSSAESREERPFKNERSFGAGRFADRKSSTEGGKKFGDKKDFREGGPRKFGDKKDFREGGQRKFGDRPYGEKPYSKGYAGKRSDDPEKRKWTSEDRFDSKNLRSKKVQPLKKDDDLIRLNRYIANAGICSRRKADELIQAGVVSVNGEVISELGYKVNPAVDVIRYNGETLKREKAVYVLLNKPKDYITTTEDPQERKTVMHLVEKASKERIYPVGRLDRNTTGLLLMTNDGDLAEKLSHPRNNITKIYQVELNKNLTQGDLNKIAFGLELEDGLIKPDAVTYVQGGSKREIGIQIHSGKNRIVRRIFEHLGYEVVKLDRVVYGNLTKKDLPRGRWRYLEEKEIIQLKHLMK